MGGNKMRNKGITMISLVITIAVISIIAGTVIYGSVQNIQERDLDLFYSDLQTLEDRVNQYEIHYGKLPTKGIFSGSIAFQSVKNPNDNDIYYNLDLNALDNLSLSRSISMQGDDVYIVNDASHTIYYPQGLTIKGEVYYRYPHEYSKIKYADKISKSTSYVGYYADIDGNKTVDGVIFADKAVGNQGSGKWNGSDDVYTIPKVTEGLKDYTISQESYTGNFGTKAVISPIGTGEERFYIMALTDIDGKTNGTYYDWYHAASDKGISDWSTITSEEFGTGKTNTATMIAKWNAKAYGYQDTCSDHKDMWGQIQTKVKDGWFVPSRAEWAAFAGELGISEDSSNEKYYGNFGLGLCYWSSSLRTTNHAWYAGFNTGYMGINRINSFYYVRLGATF